MLHVGCRVKCVAVHVAKQKLPVYMCVWVRVLQFRLQCVVGYSVLQCVVWCSARSEEGIHMCVRACLCVCVCVCVYVCVGLRFLSCARRYCAAAGCVAACAAVDVSQRVLQCMCRSVCCSGCCNVFYSCVSEY